MRILKFDKYDSKSREVPVQARAWIILWTAVGAYPAGDKEQTVVGNRAWIALTDVAEFVPDTDGARRLRPSGAETYLEDAEWRLVGKAVEAIRDQIKIHNSDALLFVDKLLEKAPEISKKDYAAKIGKLKLESGGVEG